MNRRLTYRPGTSPLHRMHPLLKAAWLIWVTALVFLVPSPWLILGLVGLALALFPLCGLRLGGLRGLRLLATTALLLALLQFLFRREGAVLWQAGPLVLTSGGLAAGAYVGGRFLVIVLSSYLFVLTTEPAGLAYALMQAGLPYRYGFALVTALRLAAILEQEGLTVYRAQLARGVQYDVRSPRRLLTLARQFFMPLLVSALGRVDSLAASMEGRCFGKYPRRTFLHEVNFGRWDAAMAALLLLAIAGAVAWLLV